MKLSKMLTEMYAPHMYLNRVSQEFAKIVKSMADGKVKKEQPSYNDGEWVCTFDGGDILSADIMSDFKGNPYNDAEPQDVQWFLTIQYKDEETAIDHTQERRKLVDSWMKKIATRDMKPVRETTKKTTKGYLVQQIFKNSIK